MNYSSGFTWMFVSFSNQEETILHLPLKINKDLNLPFLVVINLFFSLCSCDIFLLRF